MADISKEMAVQLAREYCSEYFAHTVEAEDRMAAWFPEVIQAAFKLGRNAGLEEARKLDWVEVMRDGQLVTWGDAGTLGYRVVEKLESLKDNTP